MPTTPWSIPTGKAITGATYIKDTDDNIAATLEDLVDWCNNANGAYNDYTLTGLRTNFVDLDTAQTITGIKTFSSAIVASGGVTGTASNATTAVTLTGLTSTIAELNKLDGYTGGVTELNYLVALNATGVTSTEFDYLDGVTSNIQTQFTGKASLSGATFTGAVSGITPTSAAHLTRKDYVDSQISGLALSSGIVTPTATIVTNVSTVTPYEARYSRQGNIVFVSGAIDIKPAAASSTFTRLYLTLPISSSFTSEFHASGIITARSPLQTEVGEIIAVSGNTRISIEFNATTTNTTRFRYNYSYRII